MTPQRFFFLFAMCPLIMCAALATSPLRATTTIDNGGEVTIDMPSIDIEVRDSVAPLPTTVNIVDGGQVGYALNPDGTIQMQDDGGGGMEPVISDTSRSVALFDNSILTMIGGETADSVLVSGSAVATISGGDIGDDVAVNGHGMATISGGSINDDLNVSENGRAVLSTTVVVGDDVHASGNAVVVMSSGGIDDDADFTGSSRLEMSGGEFPDELQFFDSATADFTGGVVGDDLVVADSTHVEIHSLVIDDAIEASLNSLTNVYDGEIGAVLINGRQEAIEDFTVARANIYGGTFGTLNAFSPDTNYTDVMVEITGGTFEEGIAAGGPGAVVNVSGAMLESSDARELLASNLGELNVNGAMGTEMDASATVGGALNLNDFSVGTLTVISLGGNASVNGGQADSLLISADRGNAVWRGGQFANASIEALFSSIVEIQGSDFQVDGIPVGSGDVVPASGEITGLLADGSPFAAMFTRQISPDNRIATIRLVQIPEPGTLSIAILALAGFCTRRLRAVRRAA